MCEEGRGSKGEMSRVIGGWRGKGKRTGMEERKGRKGGDQFSKRR